MDDPLKQIDSLIGSFRSNLEHVKGNDKKISQETHIRNMIGTLEAVKHIISESTISFVCKTVKTKILANSEMKLMYKDIENTIVIQPMTKLDASTFQQLSNDIHNICEQEKAFDGKTIVLIPFEVAVFRGKIITGEEEE